MEIEDLKNISNQIFKHLTKISYDESITFKGFKIEMMMNIQRFLSPNSVENYENNKKILNNAKIEETKRQSEIDKYLERLINELTDLLETIKEDNNSSKNFKYNKLEILMVLSKFLNPKTYHQNVLALKQAEEQEKSLTYPCR